MQHVASPDSVTYFHVQFQTGDFPQKRVYKQQQQKIPKTETVYWMNFCIAGYVRIKFCFILFHSIRFANYWQGHRNSMTPITAGP